MQAIRKFAALRLPQVIMLALAILVVGKLLYKFLCPQYFQASHFRALAAAVVALRVLAELPEGWIRMQTARAAGAGLEAQAMALCPAGPLGVVRFVGRLFAGCAAWLMRRPPRFVAPSGTGIGFYKKSQYPTAFAFLMLSCAIEVPIGSVIMRLMITDPVRRDVTHAIVLALLAFVVIVMLGDRHWLRSTAHALGKGVLSLRLGARLDASIALAAITDAYVIKSRKEMSQSTRSWLRMQGIAPDASIIASPFDQPNVVLVLVLDQSMPVLVHQFTIPRTGIRHLLLYVDDPSGLVEALRAARESLTANPSAPAAPAAPSPSPDTSAAVESSTWPR